jgi:hypothetical protein
MQTIISRNEAEIQNLKFYFSNHLCHNGHNTIRYVKSGECLQCIEDRKPKPTEEEIKALGRNEALNRYEAAQGRFKFYLSHHFCRNGHNRIRHVRSTQCVQCVENRKSFTDRDKALRLEFQRLRKRLKELQAEERKWKRK